MEKIFKRTDGSKVKIVVTAYIDGYGPNRTAKYATEIYTCGAKKRTFVNVVDTYNYAYRRLDREGCERYTIEKYLEVVTAEEIQEVKLAEWESLKPKM